MCCGRSELIATRGPVVAEVVVEPGPRLVAHHLVLDGFRGRAARNVPRTRSRSALENASTHSCSRSARDLVGFAVGLASRSASGPGPGSTSSILRCASRYCVLVAAFRCRTSKYASTSSTKPIVVTRELAPRAFQGTQMDVDELGALGGQSRCRQFGTQFARRAGEFARIGLRRVLDLLAQRGIAGIRVDEPFFEPVETQPEQQVFGRTRVSWHRPITPEPIRVARTECHPAPTDVPQHCGTEHNPTMQPGTPRSHARHGNSLRTARVPAAGSRQPHGAPTCTPNVSVG